MAEIGFHLNTNIKKLRMINNESQEDLGKVINKGASAIGNYEKGIRNPDYIDLYKIANHYNITIDDLVKKDLRLEQNVILDDNHKLDVMIQDKSKELTEEGKKALINIIDNLSTIDNK